MRLALFVPCYVDQLRPEIGLASLDLLEASGFETEFLESAVCCGQPFLTAGEQGHATTLGRRFVEAFSQYDAVVTPSGSCAATLRRHLVRLVPGPAAQELAPRCLELCEFLASQSSLPELSAPFPERVGLHSSCHALRELGLGTPTESRGPTRPDPAADLLGRVPGLDLIDLARRDECCGFGGVFAVEEEAVSARMGLDRLDDHLRGRAAVVTSTDVSCLLHLEGLARRRGDDLRILHVAEILATSAFGATDGTC